MKSPEYPLAVGGQAVLEGVMMRSPHALAVAVRRPDGTMILKDEAYVSLAERYPVFKRPLLRGPLILIEAMVTGIKALTFSAQAALQEEEADQEEVPLGWGLSAGLPAVRLPAPLAQRPGRAPSGPLPDPRGFYLPSH